MTKIQRLRVMGNLLQLMEAAKSERMYRVYRNQLLSVSKKK